MRFILFLAALLVAAPAAAQPAAEAAATPEQIAVARAEADRLIAAAGGADLFENITGDARPTVLHRASGLICRFEPGDPENGIAIFPSPLPRGDDVGCNVPSSGYSITHYATRYGEPITAETAAHDAVASIRQRVGEVRAHEGRRFECSAEGLPQTYIARMEVTLDGRDLYTHAVTAEMQGWIFKQRLTAPLEEAENAQITGAALWIGTLAFAHHRLFDQVGD